MHRQLVWIGVASALAAFLFAEKPAAAQDRRPAWTTSRIQGSPEPPAPYRIAEAFPGVRFDHPTSLEEAPDLGRLLVSEMSGKLFAVPRRGGPAELVGDLAASLTGDDAGKSVSLFDIELHPRFAENRQLFACYVHPGNGGHTRVSRFTLRLAPPLPIRLEEGSEQVVLTWPAGGHNGGCLEFGKEGYLYISTGDGSGPNPPDGLTTGQTVNDLLGAILRIDVDRSADGRAYAIPADNPFVDLAGARGEIWSYGLRNPWKFGVDRQTGELFVADNGWETWEVIHKAARGANGGWPIMEGRATLRSEVAIGPTLITPPIKDHPHTEANSVVGGPVYRGARLGDLEGAFIYGDYITGTIWALFPDKDQSYSHETLVDTDQRIVAFLEASDGSVFVLDYDLTGAIYELLPSDAKDTSAEFPRLLSQTGLFESLQSMAPAAGVVPYEVRVSRWMDGAAAQRFIAIPGDATAFLASKPGEASRFPEGTVLAKHLTLPVGKGRRPIPLETQILHFEAGVWRPYSYLWDEKGAEAHLSPSIGAARAIHSPDPLDSQQLRDRTWHVNAVNECKLCHNAESGVALGFSASQLHRPSSSSGAGDDQISHLVSIGVLEKPPAAGYASLVDPADGAASLEDRARSYLHANCAMCHQPGGNAIVSFYLRRDMPFDQLNTNKGTGIGTFGLADARIIAPGDPFRSLLLYRMSKLGYARMPYIGSRMVDSAAVALIESWIRSMPGEKSSPPLLESSPEAQALARAVGQQAPSAKDVERLISSTPGALALAVRMHAGELSPAAAKEAAQRGAAASDGNVRGLFETFLPESSRRATLGPTIAPETILSRKGDRQRGKLIFFSDGARCRTCHEMGDKEKSLGPTFEEIAKKYPNRGEMLLHVLSPSQKVDEPYAAWLVVTADGRTLSGLIVSQDAAQVTLKTAEKQLVRIERSDIEELRKSEKSLMPDRILSDLTAQEAADLLEYVLANDPAR